jgi:N-acetylmuramoyl-L-alanine amidase
MALVALLLAAAGIPLLAQAPAAGPRFVIVVDAAHGGDDAGATLSAGSGKSEQEKTFTLALSVRLRSLLAARGFSVVTTRESDASMPAERRAEIANRANAQACLSLHASMSGSGVHLFVSSLAPAPRTAFLPWKTAQANYVPRSLALAGALNSALMQAGVPVTLGRTALATVDNMTCPAVAIEVAPPSDQGNSGGRAIDDSGYQDRLAQALAAGLLEWRSEGRQP